MSELILKIYSFRCTLRSSPQHWIKDLFTPDITILPWTLHSLSLLFSFSLCEREKMTELQENPISSVQHERCNDFFSVTSRVSQKLSHPWLRGSQRPDNKTLSTFPSLLKEVLSLGLIVGHMLASALGPRVRQLITALWRTEERRKISCILDSYFLF